MTRVAAAIVSIALIGAVLSPVVRDPLDDGFPLSTYPMFAVARSTVQTIDYAIGQTRGGERRAIAPVDVGSEEVLQALAVIERAVARGPDAMRVLCRQIAARAGDDIAVVRIVRGTHDAVGYLVRGEPGREVELVRCAR